ncbi:hypothetical protein VMCG_08421 [Cytospora schulzeri]|uniref:Uncharacterized protein n=1 Tax=Cytospora schulzeri TaxID=448051 RepID=A0A423VQP0_9PEZI|nr:hypothetical protein VMCG_08421 [Valsa malicola]
MTGLIALVSEPEPPEAVKLSTESARVIPLEDAEGLIIQQATTCGTGSWQSTSPSEHSLQRNQRRSNNKIPNLETTRNKMGNLMSKLTIRLNTNQLDTDGNTTALAKLPRESTQHPMAPGVDEMPSPTGSTTSLDSSTGGGDLSQGSLLWPYTSSMSQYQDPAEGASSPDLSGTTEPQQRDPVSSQGTEQPQSVRGNEEQHTERNSEPRDISQAIREIQQFVCQLHSTLHGNDHSEAATPYQQASFGVLTNIADDIAECLHWLRKMSATNEASARSEQTALRSGIASNTTPVLRREDAITGNQQTVSYPASGVLPTDSLRGVAPPSVFHTTGPPATIPESAVVPPPPPPPNTTHQGQPLLPSSPGAGVTMSLPLHYDTPAGPRMTLYHSHLPGPAPGLSSSPPRPVSREPGARQEEAPSISPPAVVQEMAADTPPPSQVSTGPDGHRSSARPSEWFARVESDDDSEDGLDSPGAELRWSGVFEGTWSS